MNNFVNVYFRQVKSCTCLLVGLKPYIKKQIFDINNICLLKFLEYKYFYTNSKLFLDIYCINDKLMTKLNFSYRELNTSTNVLSMQHVNLSQKLPVDYIGYLGEIFISVPYILEESLKLGIPFRSHITRLLIHGFLHLLGFDHTNDLRANLMYQREKEILAQLNITAESILENYW